MSGDSRRCLFAGGGDFSRQFGESRCVSRRLVAVRRLCAIIVFFAVIPALFAETKQYSLDDVRVVAVHGHNKSYFTEGYFFNGDVLCETGGYWYESAYYENNVSRFKFGRTIFAEGSVMLDGMLFVLTYTNKIAYIYDAETLKQKAMVKYNREGWGLTTDGTYIIASDGSDTLYFMDKNYSVKKTLNVKQDGKKVTRINELEYIDGYIWANVFGTDDIIVIDAATGKVVARIDLSELYPKKERNSKADVMNGVAWNAKTNRLWLTGKYWDKAFELDVSRVMEGLK